MPSSANEDDHLDVCHLDVTTFNLIWDRLHVNWDAGMIENKLANNLHEVYMVVYAGLREGEGGGERGIEG